MWLYIIALQNRTRHCTQSTSIDLPGNTLTQESLWCKSVIVVSQCFSAVQNCVKYFCLPPLKFSSPPSCPPSFTGLVPPLDSGNMFHSWAIISIGLWVHYSGYSLDSVGENCTGMLNLFESLCRLYFKL